MERKKVILFYILLVYSSIMVSQTFYLKPFVESKINLPRKDYGENFQPNPIIKYKSDKVIMSPYLINSCGLMLGYKSKNKKTSFETGINYMQTASGGSVYFLEYVTLNQDGVISNYYTPSTYHIRNTVSMYNIPFYFIHTFERNILKEKRNYKLFISYLLGFSFAPKGSSGPHINYHDKRYAALLSPNEMLYIHSYSERGISGDIYRGYSRIYSFGISFRIDNNKSAELFTISTNFYYGQYYKSATMFDINLNSTQSLYFYSVSTGTGFGFSISRNFSLYKFKGKYKEKA